MQISIVVPCYNEEQCLPLFYDKIIEVLDSQNIRYELLFVDDGSKDSTRDLIKGFCDSNPDVRGVILSRNFGHQSALIAGIEESKGDAVLMMDSDLQHPPSLIPEMINKLIEGYDVVNTIRLETKDSSFLKNVTSKYFYKLINSMSDVEIKPGAADFRLMNRKATDAFLTFNEKARFNRGLVSWMGFRTYYLNFEAPARAAGNSKYSVKKMFRFAKTGITSFSPKPLKIASILGVISLILGLTYGTYIIYKAYNGETVPGWASTTLLILVLGGVQMVSVGILGEYISMIYDEAKNRPLFFVQEILNKKEEKNF